jgi:hypothetical protein
VFSSKFIPFPCAVPRMNTIVESFRIIMYLPPVMFFSKFSDIFDEDRFIETLRQHVRVVKELPKDVLLRFNHNISSILNMRTKAYSSPDHYLRKE